MPDDYAYIGKPRPADPKAAPCGIIGTDFLTANRAVVDFGNVRLYLRGGTIRR